MTSFIAADGSGRSTSFIPAVPAAWSVTTIAFIVHLLACGLSWSVMTSHPMSLIGRWETPMTQDQMVDVGDLADNPIHLWVLEINVAKNGDPAGSIRDAGQGPGAK